MTHLRLTDVEDVPVLELLTTLFDDVRSTSTASLSKILDITDVATGLYRDPTGTLVVRHKDHTGPRLSLIWPVGRHMIDVTDTTTIVGENSEVFLLGAETETVVPLPAVAPGRCVYGWGSPGTAAVNLYLAIVYTISGIQPPVPHPRHVDNPDSLYGWLVRKDHNQELRITWSEAVRRVDADAPLRQAIHQAARTPTVSSLTPNPQAHTTCYGTAARPFPRS